MPELCTEMADTMLRKRALREQKFTRRLEFSAVLVENSARLAQNRGKRMEISAFCQAAAELGETKFCKACAKSRKAAWCSDPPEATPPLKQGRCPSGRRGMNRDRRNRSTARKSVHTPHRFAELPCLRGAAAIRVARMR